MITTPGSSRKFSIRFTVGSMFLFATIFTALFAISLQYYFSKQMSEEHVLSKLTMATAEVSEYIQQVDANATSSASILRSVSLASRHQFSELETRDIFVQVLKDNPLFYSIYFGMDNEDFYQIINLESSPIVREKIDASAEDRWVIIKINGDSNNRVRRTNYYTEDFALTKSQSEQSNYFPTKRPWFHAASSDKVFKTEPYLFQHLKITGQTYSVRSKRAVIGIDIVLSSVSEKITTAELGLTRNSDAESFIFNDTGEVIASNIPLHKEVAIPSAPPLTLTDNQIALVERTRSLMVSNKNDWGPYDFALAGEPKGYTIDLLKIIAQQTGLKFEFVNGFDATTLVGRYREGSLDILHSVSGGLNQFGYESHPLFYAELAIAANKKQPLPSTLTELTQQRVGVIGDSGMRNWLLSRYPTLNIVELPGFDAAKTALHSGKIRYLIDTYQTLNELNELEKQSSMKVARIADSEPISFHLYMKNNDSEVLDVINSAINAITPAQRLALKAKWLDSNLQRGSVITYPELYELSQTPSLHNSMVSREINGETKFFYVTSLLKSQGQEEFFAVVIPKMAVTEQVLARLFKSILLTISVMLILLPVAWIFGTPIVRPITALKRETEKIRSREFQKVALVDTRIKEVYELSHSMADMAKEIQRHEQSQEEFVEAFIRLIAQAIDDKSPYTAGHCNRVPELGLMLAKAAEDSVSGKFKDFAFKNDDERREFRIAAWLHDCGKITTPEHIVDKGTKLEANYNRIHEIRTRFEVLWRDAEIRYLKALIAGKQTKREALDKLHKQQRKLKEDFEFIASSNVGGEFMGEKQIERISQISEQTWIRHFDDRLGLSPIEEMNKPKSPLPLPVTEKLLADKPEHIIKRIRPMEFDPKFGIQMEVPEHQYNIGEIYNLSVSRGTLTTEDRFKINEHMISGIKMLEALPFPEELSRVPRYASTHHETLKGTGYPRKLSAKDLSIPERILVIADIFEALTAADRPYKQAKPISVAVDIMYKMALDEHIDMELFLLFLESEAYLEYAYTFLPEKQIDKVDTRKYLTASAKATTAA